ncbi:MAG: anaerobic ribonucleoside-triphosphate reductase activating protein [Eubacteriales bacterium]
MKIVGLQKNSFVDYPKNIAAVLFLAGCNFDCWYCHNTAVCQGNTGVEYSIDDILAFLDQRKKILDGVVITGGEPLVTPDISPLVKAIKSKDLLVKLDTNGAYPERLQALIDQGLIDFIAMDIKATVEKYPEVIRGPFDEAAFFKSIQIIMQSGIDYEFRTTVVPQLTLEDMETMAGYIKGAKSYALQQYRAPENPPSNILPLPLKPSFFHTAKERISPMVEKIILRGL